MKRSLRRVAPVLVGISCVAAFGLLLAQAERPLPDPATGVTVIGWNDLGMHCMNQDFSQFMILPPYNTLHAQVIEKHRQSPQIIESNVRVLYQVPGNTRSSNKTNFWKYAQALLGKTIVPDVGLSGNRLSGEMTATGQGDWVVTGIPLTPRQDWGMINCFQLAEVRVQRQQRVVAGTRAVVPVSWELRCDLCHHGGDDAPKSILDAHDRLHSEARLYDPATGGPAGGKPVLCGSCHAQPELGIPDNHNGAVSSLSMAMHHAHSSRMMDVMDSVPGGNVCYACHPGPVTQCLRDVHASHGMVCADCHAGGTKDSETAMLAIAAPGRQPWVSEPRCDDCHHVNGHEYEQAGGLFKNSRGHGGIYCEACHNSTHAIAPARDFNDNVQALSLQGHTGTIDQCTVCHSTRPRTHFYHRWLAAPAAAKATP